MTVAFVGSDALAGGLLTRGQLRWNFRAVVPGIYVPKSVDLDLRIRTEAVWLWTRRRGVIAGRAAAALHGARWVDESTAIEVITEHTRPRTGVIVREERLCLDEVTAIDGITVTTPERTALDLARHLPRDTAVPVLDALARATDVHSADVLSLAATRRGARGIRRAAVSLTLMDAGAESPRESWLRLVLVDAGLPTPRTQVPVSDGVTNAFVDLGWDDYRVGIEYEGAHHSTQRDQYVRDIRRSEFLDRQGWLIVKVVAEHSRSFIVHRAAEALARRGRAAESSA